jgi:hypothetical protein
MPEGTGSAKAGSVKNKISKRDFKTEKMPQLPPVSKPNISREIGMAKKFPRG